jgi:hypothetical protein
MNRIRNTTAALAALATAGLTAGALALPTFASADTVACSTHTIDPFCGGQNTEQLVPQALSVQNIPGSRSGQALVAVTPAVTRRQDFDQRVPTSGGSGSGGPDKIFRWAPSGVPSKWCMTDVGGLRSPVRLMGCTGANNQIWKPVLQATGVNWVNKATGLALTNASGSVQVRSIGTGTALNKRWIFVP